MLLPVKTKVALLIAAGAVGALGWTFVKRPLMVSKAVGPALPAPAPVEGVSLSIIRGAEMTAREGFSVRGGSLTKELVTSVASFVIEHPEGLLLIDAGVGRDVARHLDRTPLLMRALAELTTKTPTIDALATRGLRPADVAGLILTHSHWDHVSGLAELRSVPVWMTPEELTFARSADAGGALFRELEAASPLELRALSFESGPYGPFGSSCDFFGDGSVIVVPMPGHTPGSVGVFVTDAKAKRVLIIGDASWTKEGIDWPAEKPWLARRMVDHDAAKVRELLVLLHRLARTDPEMLIVPAHDRRVHEQIPSF
jgi:glyoxylase-like metal-dependent hydrolase (beta-lactamase superfamily II)